MPIVNIDEPKNANRAPSGYGGLVDHIMQIVRENRSVRDREFKKRWDQYERTFRGMYSAGSDKTREGERSRLVAPALAASIESIAASMEDAVFSRERWFDINDDILDQNPQEVRQALATLNEDMELAGVPDAIAKIILNGTLYGTGIGKMNVTRREVREIGQNGEVKKDYRPMVTLEAIPPWEFVIDSQARDIKSAYFVAHETHVPRNVIWSRQKAGTYRNVPLIGNSSSTTASPAGQETPDGKNKSNEYDGSVFVTEYYGLVPAAALKGVADVKPDDIQGNGHVEVIVTIGNELEVLRAVVNPFIAKDRPVVAYQHSVIPGKFWGRGAAEKGWNAQRALDAELRARMDALGLLTSPMMGADITRLPRNPDMRVRPGKVWLTRGRPSEVLEPVQLGNIDPNTFNQSSEMERLVQVGTGAIESNAPLNVDRRNETASGIGMIQSSALKRMRRTMWNLERQFLNPMIRGMMHRYMQFSKDRYPKDFEFRVDGTMGMIAKEFEQAQLTGMLSNIPPESPQYNLILRAIIELSSSPKRDEILQQLDKLNEPDPEAEKIRKEMEQLQLEQVREGVREQKLENEKTIKEVEKLEAEIMQIKVLTQLEDEKMDVAVANVKLGHEKIATQREKMKSDEKIAKQKGAQNGNSGTTK
jgi:hypothetical protein